VVIIGEGHFHIQVFTRLGTNKLLFKAGNETTGSQLQCIILCFTPFEGFVTNESFEVEGDGVVTGEIAVSAMDMLQVDPNGFDAMDRRLLQTIIEKFDGGPVGVDSLSAAIGEERGTIEDVIEPYLIQQGFLMRTARGRVATKNAYLHLGLTPPASQEPAELPLFKED